MTDTPPSSPTDDALKRMMEDNDFIVVIEDELFANEASSFFDMARAVFARIHPLLEARGIALAALECRRIMEELLKAPVYQDYAPGAGSCADSLDAMARRHAEGSKPNG